MRGWGEAGGGRDERDWKTTATLFLHAPTKRKRWKLLIVPGAWDDLLGFNNWVGGQMNCEDGKCVYLKCTAVEKMLEHMQEILSPRFFFFFFFTFLLFLSPSADMKQLGLRSPRARGVINRAPDARELKLEGA